MNLHTQAQADDSEYTSNAGHSSCSKQLSIIKPDISGRTVYHQCRSIGCGWRGESVMGGRGVNIDVPERESRSGHGWIW
jgi:hypothetical protein